MIIETSFNRLLKGGNMNIKDCIGCRSMTNKETCLWFDDDLNCPCASCIVKPMCSFSCDLLDDHISLMKTSIMVKDKS